MRSELWIKLCLFFGAVNCDSWQWDEEDDGNYPCIPVGYKCYTTDDCCSGATCVAAKWSPHLVCLVAGYKEDVKLDRIGRKKEVEPQDLEYLYRTYGFTVDYTKGLFNDPELPDTPFTEIPDWPVTDVPVLPITEVPDISPYYIKDRTSGAAHLSRTPLPENTDSFLSHDSARVAHFGRDELLNFKNQVGKTSENDFINERVNKKPNYVRNKRSYDSKIYMDNDNFPADDPRIDSQYSDYIDPFSSNIDTEHGTLIDNITSGIKQLDSDFKSLSYNSLENLLQNLTGFEFSQQNFSWPFPYNKTRVPTVSPVEPVTVPERLWNLSIQTNRSRDYPDLDFGETYRILNGNNYTREWLMGEPKQDSFSDSINFNLSSVTHYLSSFDFGFFKGKNESGSNSETVSSWQKMLSFMHSERNNLTKLGINGTVVVSVKTNSSNSKYKNTWQVITGFFHNGDDESIKFNLIPTNISERNPNISKTVDDVINNVKEYSLNSNFSCLFLSLLNTTKFEDNIECNGKSNKDKNVPTKENSRRLWKKVADNVGKKNLKKTDFDDVVTQLMNTNNTEDQLKNDTGLSNWGKFKSLFTSSKKSEVVKQIDYGVNEKTVDNDQWWPKFAHFFQKNEKNFNISSPIREVNITDESPVNRKNFETFVVKKDAENSNFWDRIKSVVHFKSETTTVSPEVSPATNVSDFMRRYLAWSADHNKHFNIIKEVTRSNIDNLEAVSKSPATEIQTPISTAIEGSFWNSLTGFLPKMTDNVPKMTAKNDYFSSYFDEGLSKSVDSV